MKHAQTGWSSTARSSRLDRRKAATRGALIDAAQRLMAAGRINVPVQEITEEADLGTGSFYNHFASKEELFAAATDDAVEQQADLLDAATKDIEDPAVVFAQSFRLTGRMHRVEPRLSKVILSNGLRAVVAQTGMAPRARRDIEAAVAAGSYHVVDIEATMVTVIGSALALGQLIHDRPDLDDAALTDHVTGDLLRMLGMTPEQAQAVCSLPLPTLE